MKGTKPLSKLESGIASGVSKSWGRGGSGA
jgi:hypothetical protein